LLQVGEDVGPADADGALAGAEAVVGQLARAAQAVDGRVGQAQQPGHLADGQQVEFLSHGGSDAKGVSVG
jgi:hypothetical protein